MTKFIDLTLPTPQENLACDEALLDLCEGGYPHEILRFWEPRDHFVVLGYSNKISTEVNLPYCEKNGIPVLRRTSGGGTVLQGPGSLNYALILNLNRNTSLRNITASNRFIMERNARALESLAPGISVKGHTDLTQGLVKFSGNAQRRKRHHLLFHGTFLLDFKLELIEETLPLPSREPDYRRRRNHLAFLTNLKLKRAPVKNALKTAWNAGEEIAPLPPLRIDELIRQQYGNREWIRKF